MVIVINTQGMNMVLWILHLQSTVMLIIVFVAGDDIQRGTLLLRDYKKINRKQEKLRIDTGKKLSEKIVEFFFLMSISIKHTIITRGEVTRFVFVYHYI